MNREILFRGKRIDNGEWIIGDLTTYTDTRGQKIYEILDKNNPIDVYIPSVLGDLPTQMPAFINVDENTIGQYTGLTDKNGDEIYEGDILEFDRAEIPEEERAEVVYIASEGCFKLKNPRYDYMDDLNSLTASMEIIVGNTYDGIYGEDKRGSEE